MLLVKFWCDMMCLMKFCLDLNAGQDICWWCFVFYLDVIAWQDLCWWSYPLGAVRKVELHSQHFPLLCINATAKAQIRLSKASPQPFYVVVDFLAGRYAQHYFLVTRVPSSHRLSLVNMERKRSKEVIEKETERRKLPAQEEFCLCARR